MPLKEHLVLLDQQSIVKFMADNTKQQVREFYDQIGWSQVGEDSIRMPAMKTCARFRANIFITVTCA